MTKLKQSWKSEESIFNQLDNKLVKVGYLNAGNNLVPIFKIISDIYTSLEVNEVKEAMIQLDILGCMIQASVTKEAADRMQEFMTFVLTSDMDKDLEEILKNES